MNRALDWMAFTRRGQITAGVAELALVLIALGLPHLGRRLNRPTPTP